jgi:hypothetical protein
MVKEPLLPRSSQALSKGITASGAETGTKPATQARTQTVTNPATLSAQAGPPRPASTVAIKYVDLPELSETFADSVNAVSFDGQTLRLEFGVTRFDQASEQRPTTGRRYPASRIVLTRSAALEMINRLQQVATAITQSGQAKADATKPAGGTASERTR